MTLAPCTDLSLVVPLTGPGPLLVTRGGRAGSWTAAVDEPTTVLHGWHPAQTVLRLLRLVAGPSTVRTTAAVQHAAHRLETATPGSAALCGLARALHTPAARRLALVRDVVARAGAAADDGRTRPAPLRALAAVRALAAAAPDDPAALAPLFLRYCRIPAGAQVRLLDHVPTLVLDGALTLNSPGADADLAVGGLLTPQAPPFETDVTAFTETLRAGAAATPPPRTAAPQVSGPIRAAAGA